MKKILVFGASGETGRYFIDYCINKGLQNEYELVAIGKRKTELIADYFRIKYISMDITKECEFSTLPQDEVYAVVHLAGYMPARSAEESPRKMIDVNLTGTINILEYCKKLNVDRILYAQTFGDIVGHAEEKIYLTSNMVRKYSFNTDHTIYVIAKSASVDAIEHYHQYYGLKRFIYRLPTIYSYGSDRFFYLNGIKSTLWYRVLIDRAYAGDDLEVWGDASRVKDIIYVKDFAQMLYLGLFVNRDEGFYNVGTGIGTSLIDQLSIMADVFSHNGKKSKIILRSDKPNTPQYIMDITPAINELGYMPYFSYEKYLIDYKEEMLKKRFDNF